MYIKFKAIIKILLLVIGFQEIAFAQCDPGDYSGKSGCPDPDGNCDQTFTGLHFTIPIIRPCEPNEIIGPAGYGPEKWVSVNATMPYKIYYENDPLIATAPAQKVIVYMPIHSNLNPNTFRLGDFGFANLNFTIPPNSASYYKRLDVRDSLGLYVDITAGLDQVNNRAFWIFQSIDPLTGTSSSLAPTAGYLAINDTLIGNGLGYVNYTIKPYTTDQSGDSVTAQAFNTFDTEDPVPTNIEFNIIDANKPQSQINPIITTGSNIINLSWIGSDMESGLRNYSIFFSADGGPYQPLILDTTMTNIQFIGQNGFEYRFYSIATDNAGNKEDVPSNPDVVVQVGNNNVLLDLKAFIQGFYIGYGTMTPTLFNQGASNDQTITDSILVELRQANFPYSIMSTSKAILQVNGHALVNFQALPFGSYYLVVNHRYALQTWSANPIEVNSFNLSYDFSTDMTQAYGNNLKEAESGVWILYSGDINQDENIDLLDMASLENEISNFYFGYYSEDVNGDGNVDLLDVPILEDNVNMFIFSSHP